MSNSKQPAPQELPIDGCAYCANNKPGIEAGRYCANNCVSGSHFKPMTPQDLRERWQKLRTDAVSEMFETGPDKDGIYRTTALYKKLDTAFDLLAAEVAGDKELHIEALNNQVYEMQQQAIELRQRIAELEEEIQQIHWNNIESENRKDIL